MKREGKAGRGSMVQGRKEKRRGRAKDGKLFGRGRGQEGNAWERGKKRGEPPGDVGGQGWLGRRKSHFCLSDQGIRKKKKGQVLTGDGADTIREAEKRGHVKRDHSRRGRTKKRWTNPRTAKKRERTLVETRQGRVVYKKNRGKELENQSWAFTGGEGGACLKSAGKGGEKKNLEKGPLKKGKCWRAPGGVKSV